MAKYTTVGPFAFKRDKRKPNSIKALKPVTAPKEQRRAFARSNTNPVARANARARAAGRKAAREEARNAKVRQYFGLDKSGEKSRKNPFDDLLRGGRLTTDFEKAQKVPLKRQHVPVGAGFAVIGGATEKERKSPGNRAYERATGMDTSKPFLNRKGRAVRPYGLTTKDEHRAELIKRSATDRKIRAKTAADRKRKRELDTTIVTSQLTKSKVHGASTAPDVSAAVAEVKKINKSLDTRSKLDRKTEAEGMLKALENLSRPYYGVNAGLKAGVKGQSPKKIASAVGKGTQLKRGYKTESWDVLEAAGVKNKWVKYGVGIPAAFATDPASYIALAGAPASGGASLTALSGKGAAAAKYIGKINKGTKLAERGGLAAKAGQRSANRAQKKLDKLLNVNRVSDPAERSRLAKQAKIQGAKNRANPKPEQRLGKHRKNPYDGVSGPLSAGQMDEVEQLSRGVSVGLGGRIPFTQKFVGIRTSGKVSANLLNARKLGYIPTGAGKGNERFGVKTRPYAGPAGGAKDAWTHHMGPTGRLTGLTKKESDDIVQAAAVANAAETTAGGKRKATVASINNVIKGKHYLNQSRAKRVLRPRAAKKEQLAERARLAERYDAGEDIGVLGKHLDQFFEGMLDKERKQGIRTGDFAAESLADAQKYLPRYWKSQIEKKAHKRLKKIEKYESAKDVPLSAGTTPHSPFSEHRAVRKKLTDTDDFGDPRNFVRDIAGVTGKRVQESEEALGRKGLNDAVVATGRRVDEGVSPSQVPKDSTLYRYQNGRLTPVGEGAKAGKSTNAVQFVIVKNRVKERADELVGSAGDSQKARVPFGRTFDKATGRWKGVVTVANPGYYLRNLVGDSILASQANTDAKSLADAVRLNRQIKKRDKKIRKGDHITGKSDPDAGLEKLTFKIDGKTYTGKELEEMASKSGAISTGTHGSEVSQLVGSDSLAATNPLARMNIRRENLPRLGTFMADLKRGNSVDNAAAHTRKHHYDYGTRTEFQKQARRVIPFFSWWDLNTRNQLRTLVTDPGKTNKIFHTLNGAASAAGFEDYRDYLGNLPAGKQRGLPIPIVYGHDKNGNPKIKDVQFGNVLTDLRSALTKSPSKWADEVLARANPLIGKPAELSMNHSGFFRGPISNEDIPGGTRAKVPGFLSTGDKLDRKDGKYYPSASRKLDYAIRSLGPQVSFLMNLGTKGPGGRFEKSDTDALLGLTGLSPSEHNPTTAKLDKLYSHRSKLQNKWNDLHNVRGASRRQKDLKRRINGLTNEIRKVQIEDGWKKPIKAAGKQAGKGGKNLTPAQQLRQEIFGTSGSLSGELRKSIMGDDSNPLDDLKKDLQKSIDKPTTKKPSIRKQVGKISNLDKSQKDIVATIIAVGKKRGVPQKHIIAALETGRVESNFANSATMTDHDSQGWRQERASLYKDPTNLKASVNRFYDETAQADRKGLSPGDLAAAVQRPAAQYRGRYALHESEAKAILARVGGAKAPSSKPSRGPHSTAYTVSAQGGKNALTPLARSTMKNIASRVKFKPEVTSGKRPGSITTSGNVSDHDSGNGLDIGVGGDIRSGGDARKGDALAYAALRSAGQSHKEAKANAKKGGVFNVVKNGTRYQILWKTNTGGNHYNHVHVGVKGGAGADSSSSSGGGGGGGYAAPAPGAGAPSTGGSGAALATSPTEPTNPQGMTQDQRVLALMDYINNPNKKRANRKLLRDYSIGKTSIA